MKAEKMSLNESVQNFVNEWLKKNSQDEDKVENSSKDEDEQ